MTKIVLAILGTGITGFLFGWVTAVFMTAGKVEDAYAAGYDQAAHDLAEKSTKKKG